MDHRKVDLMRRDLAGMLIVLSLATPFGARAEEQASTAPLPRLGMDPGEPQEPSAPPSLPFGISPAESKAYVLDFHGYFQVPLKIGVHERTLRRPGQTKTVLHTPPLIPQDRRSFEFTGVVPEPWIQLNFIYGNQIVSGTAILAGTGASDATGVFNPVDQIGVQDAFVTVNLSKALKTPVKVVKAKRDTLHEANPMLGHRGCRLGVTFPEIYEMQVRAIMEAACEVKKEGIDVEPEIMIPLVGHVKELELIRTMTVEVAEEIMKSYKVKLNYMVGTMIELPRAAITADEIAEQAEFFSFGTNDLTQTTFGLSRDDAGKFLPVYVEKKILPKDPFQALDQGGVGELVRIGIEKGRKTRKKLKVGICGEHGGEPSSIDFCHRVGMNYVSCSPFRVPIARLAAAHAALNNEKKKK